MIFNIFWISIHAPTKGATQHLNHAFCICADFNPRTHKGCDSQCHGRLYNHLDFNPRTHKGCDVKSIGSPEAYTNFNPRTHKGCDPTPLITAFENGNFNPRTHKGCDQPYFQAVWMLAISIHAPTKGATTTTAPIPTAIAISIHAPTKGATDSH